MENFEQRLERIERLTMLSAKSVFTVDEAVLFTGISKTYMYKLTSKKLIPYYRGDGGKLIYFDKTELENWMKATRVKTVSEIETDADEFLSKKAGR